MRKLNFKNKIFIFIFAIIILGIIGLLVYAVKLVGNKGKDVYDVSSNTVIFSQDSNLIDTKDGGKIEKKWNGNFYYLTGKNDTYELGLNPVVYESSSEDITLFGDNYQILNEGSINLVKDSITINDPSTTYFYKLDDRVYLIISDEIYNETKSIYANKYLLVYIDKQGNASVLNDALNVKTINPMKLVFGNYTFDIANELLIVGEKTVNLKTVIGSTNEYVVPPEKEDVVKYDPNSLIDSYNELVGDFNKYTTNNNMQIAANNQVEATTNNTVINNTEVTNNNQSNTTVQNSSAASTTVKNKTVMNKRVNLRGAISYPTYIDVSYLVTDPENKYQAVYLVVTGEFDGKAASEKIILDKYATSNRIVGLTPNHEYSISLGYIEILTDEDTGEKSLADNIEDVINVRTSKVNYNLKIEKISNGNVYFNYKMTNDYAFDTGEITLYSDGMPIDTVVLDSEKTKSANGYSNKLKLDQGNVFEIKVENATYGGKDANIPITKTFTIP